MVYNNFYTDTSTLKVYGDNKLLYKSPSISSDSEILKIEIDVTDVSILKFQVETSGYWGYAGYGDSYTDLRLADARLTQ